MLNTVYLCGLSKFVVFIIILATFAKNDLFAMKVMAVVLNAEILGGKVIVNGTVCVSAYLPSVLLMLAL